MSRKTYANGMKKHPSCQTCHASDKTVKNRYRIGKGSTGAGATLVGRYCSQHQPITT